MLILEPNLDMPMCIILARLRFSTNCYIRIQIRRQKALRKMFYNTWL